MAPKFPVVITGHSDTMVDERTVGGKGLSLIRLQSAGILVPRFAIIASDIFCSAIGDRMSEIHHYLSHIDYSIRASLQQASSQIASIIRDVILPAPLVQEISAVSSALFESGGDVAVRSSVVGEDSLDHSFAGLMDSYLHVSQENLIDSIKKVWGSAFSERALMYRHRKMIGVNDIITAVILQRMVNSVTAGVLFTRDTESGAVRCVISAGYGLGEGIVANLVETDTYFVDRTTQTISKHVHAKTGHFIRETSSGRGTTLASVPKQRQSQPALTDKQIGKLSKVGLKIEKMFGTPQDIEWTFDDKGVLYILQARPIVGWRELQGPKDVQIWDNSNIVESYPGITLPLTFSIVREGYEHTFRNAAAGLLPTNRRMVHKLSLFKNMIGLLNGRVYYNLLNWYRMLSYLPGFHKRKKAWDQMIGISQKLDVAPGHLSMFDRFISFIVLIWKLLTVRRNAVSFFAMFGPFYQRLRSLNLESMSEFTLLAVYEEIRGAFDRMWHLTLYNDLAAMTFYDWLIKLCTKWKLNGHPNLHNDLLCGEKGVESVEPLRSMIRIANAIDSTPSYKMLFDNVDDSAIWEAIESDNQYSDLKDALHDHLDSYGDRGLEELKLEQPSFRQNPAAVIHLIKTYAQLGISVEAIEIQEKNIRTAAESYVTTTLGSFWKRILFLFILTKTRNAVTNRENMRFARSRLYGILRRLFQRLGTLLVQRGFLDAERDVFYLTVEELFGLLHATTPTLNLRSLVEIRKNEYATFSEQILEERIETQGIPALNDVAKSKVAANGLCELHGIGCSSGSAIGKAKIVEDPTSINGETNYILVAISTDPGWVFLMIASKGLIVEKGSVLSHTAIIGRELGIPTIVGVKNATRLIPDGATITLDGQKGVVRW
ncbi:MAG TPA: PEP/pyruvate-binding domain-containing protein [Bacteroidota bacterium]|nr:PEP/pyruvate-binding domain-containing protein [Bacteroidota bacterium]